MSELRSQPAPDQDQVPARHYRSEIDGLRAIAVLAVVLFHADLGLPGGFVGVDVFFVISGFLVTGIIARALNRDTDRDRFSLTDFYCRRVRRIFPAAVVVTFVIMALAFRSALPGQWVAIANASVAQSFFLGNVFFWLESGYFSRDVLTKPLLHYWSLAVEEQFYLFFPWLLLLFNRPWIKQRVSLANAILVIGILSFAISLVGTWRSPSATFYWLPTRAWELLVGGWIAVRHLRHDRENASSSTSLVGEPRSDRTGFDRAAPDGTASDQASAQWISGAGLLAIIASYFVIDEASMFPGFWALLPVLGTAAVIIGCEHVPTHARQLLSNRVLVGIGLISYSWYLWHWPAFAFLRMLVLQPSLGARIAVVLLTLLLAAASWALIEQPIRRRKILASNRSLLAVAGGAWGVVLLIGIGVVISDGFPGRFDQTQQTLIRDAQWTGNESSRDLDDVSAGNLVALGKADTTGSDDLFLLWGDSHAMTWTAALDNASKAEGRSGYAALHGGTPPIPGLWRKGMPAVREFNDAVMRWILDRRVRDVILVSRWSVYIDSYSAADPRTGGRRDDDVYLSDTEQPSQNGQASLAALQRQFERFAIQMKSNGVRVWLVRQVPVQQTVVAEAAIRNRLLGWNVNSILPTSRSRHRQQQASVQPFYDFAAPLAQATGGDVLDVSSQFFDADGRGIVQSEVGYLFRDDDHLSYTGAQRLVPELRRLLRK